MSTIELNTYITDAEWEVMRVVWANDRVTSKKVISVLKEKMDWTQSTIKTILGRLVEKGVLNTEQEGRKFIYTANICLLYTSPSPRDKRQSRMPSSA